MTTAKRLFWASAIGLLVGAGYGLGQRREKATERRLRQLFGEAANTNDLVDSFVTYIRDDARTNLKGFKDLRRADPESALAEAIGFGVLHRSPRSSECIGPSPPEPNGFAVSRTHSETDRWSRDLRRLGSHTFRLRVRSDRFSRVWQSPIPYCYGPMSAWNSRPSPVNRPDSPAP